MEANKRLLEKYLHGRCSLQELREVNILLGSEQGDRLFREMFMESASSESTGPLSGDTEMPSLLQAKGIEMNNRTAIWHEDFVIGEGKWLRELFESAVEIKVEKNSNNTALITIKNNSDLPLRLSKAAHDPRLVYLRNDTIDPYIVKPNGTLDITVRLNEGISGGDVNFCVENFLVESETGMSYTVKL